MLDKIDDRTFYDDVIAGLSKPQKAIPPKYFYDERGSELFDAICDLREYYPTRTETALLARTMPRLSEALRDVRHLIEYGSGSSKKTALVLDSLRSLESYVPVDISAEYLLSVADRLCSQYPNLRIAPLVGDFTQKIALPSTTAKGKKAGFFPGSTIGNLSADDRREFLARARNQLGNDAFFVLGADLVKDRSVLRAAYNDAAGVTALFNLNLLRRINRELGADFNESAFRHQAVWSEEHSRIEMHLFSKARQTVWLDGNRFEFRDGESIHTENSHKFTTASLNELAETSGWRVSQMWIDEELPFAIALLAAV